MKKIYIFIVSLFIPLFVGFLSGYISSDSVYIYKELVRPPFAPPAWVFGYAWTILYILMGISSYIICISTEITCSKIWIKTYYVHQLVVNFFWSILFFTLGLRLLAFFWILLLIFLVYKTIKNFSYISSLASKLLYPYFLWICFAAYLNLGFIILN